MDKNRMLEDRALLYEEISTLNIHEKAFISALIHLMVSYNALYPNRPADWEDIIHVLLPELKQQGTAPKNIITKEKHERT